MSLIQTNKERYRILCNDRNDIPLFMQAWWMDAVCKQEEWDVILYEEKEIIVGALPYLLICKYGFKIIIQPQLSQYNGIWINYPENSNLSKIYSFEKEVMNNLIDQLEQLNIHYYEQNFHYSVTNWQPFYWKGYKQSTRYSYQLKNIVDTDKIFSNFHLFKKKHIVKAQKKLKVDYNLSVEDFYSFQTMSLSVKGHKNYCSEIFFKKMAESAIERNQGAVIAIRDNENNIHSAMFVVWDKMSAYYLVSAINPTYKSSGASILMVWEAILFLSNKTKTFDFEGSMIEGVAKANQEFGAEQIPYFTISKSNSALFSFLLKINK